MTPGHTFQFERTPDSRFSHLPGFEYKPHYLYYGNLRMAYLDERVGPQNQETQVFLCLHGQPTWSYLYRHMIPVFLHFTTDDNVPISRRVIAPDLLGFGRSDKPVSESVYTFNFHRDSLLHFIRALELTNITLVVQDWGGILGLTLPSEESSRFRRLIVMNTTIATGQVKPTEGFLAWKDFSNRSPDLDIGKLMGRAVPHLSPAEREAYNAPFPAPQYKAGVRRFPNLVMISEDMEGASVSKAARDFLSSTNLFRQQDVFMACGMKDPVLGVHVMKPLSNIWTNGCYCLLLPDAGHFVQEWGKDVATKAIQTFESQHEAVGNLFKIQPWQAVQL